MVSLRLWIMLRWFILLLLSLPLMVAAVPLTLKESLVETLKNNFDVRINSTTVDDKRALYTKALGNFDFQLSGTVTRDHNKTPSASSLDGVTSAVVTDNFSLKPTLTKKTALGTEISVPYSYVKTVSNSSNATLPESHNTSLSLKLTQPLLRAYSKGYFSRDLAKAELEIEAAKQKYGQQLLDVCDKTLGLYLDTLRDNESLKVKEKSVHLSQETYDLAKMKHDLGKASLVDLLEAEGVLLKSKESLLSTRTALDGKFLELQLAVFANSATKIEITEDLTADLVRPPDNLSEESLIQEALKTRPELRANEIALREARMDVRSAETDQLPVLNFEGSVTYKGVADKYSASQEQINKGRFSSYSTGLKLEQPIMGYAAKGEMTLKSLRLQQEELRISQAKRNVELNVRKDLRNYTTTWERIETLQKMVLSEQQRFEGQTLRYRQGKISIFDLTRSQQDLENAELESIKAKIAYKKARLDLAVSVGRLFKDYALAQ